MRNLTMMTDFYELTMSQAYFKAGKKDEVAVFDAFFRKNPLGGGYGVMGGVDRIIDFIKNAHFNEEDINYLRTTGQFTEDFLEYLKGFKFTGSISAIPDGTPVFGNEPIVTVKAPIIEAQIIETILLSFLNANICYTTAATRVVEAANGIGVMEFGARRAMGPEAALEASKCAVIAGCVGTSNVLAGQEYGVPVMGTMAHSLVTEADTEYEAFLNYAKAYPNNCVLLVDTYDVLKSGVPNAIRVAKEYLIPNGYKLKGIRIDSGDLAYLSKEAKKMFVKAGLPDVKICLSNGLNEKTIKALKEQGAVIDIIGLGDNIVLPDKARVGVVYKNVAVERNGEFVSRIKVSNDAAKAITPGYKKVYRFYDKETGYALGDVIALHEEHIPLDEFTLIDPLNEHNTLTIKNYRVRELQVPIFVDGKLVYEDPTIKEKQAYHAEEMKTLYPEVKRTENPHGYYIDLTRKLLELKKALILEAKAQKVEYDIDMKLEKKI
ncbi:MAG: nicotinate phosphoribosyltransferase [Firmicutes bacterium]|nr:nicotinate phosphoribosyltransferase [Bacillota bacterium]